MLGIKRIRERRDGHDKVTVSMTAFVDGMVKSFEEHLPKTNPDTPFPAKKWLYQTDASAEESKEVLDLGYQRIVEMLLWACMGTFLECGIGLHQLIRVMCSPSRDAWKCALHMVNRMRVNRSRIIVFSDGGNPNPVVFSNAFNKPDETDGKSQYGVVTMWYGGPVATVSKNLPHVGLSAFHNEYMALRYATAHAVWLCQLQSTGGRVGLRSGRAYTPDGGQYSSQPIGC